MANSERQLHFRGFHPSRDRLRRGRRALKSLSRGEKSVVLDDVMASGLSQAYKQSLQANLSTRGAFSYREVDRKAQIYALSPHVVDSLETDVDNKITEQIRIAKRRRLSATTVADALANLTRQEAARNSFPREASIDHLFHVYELIGQVYMLQDKTVGDFKRKALKPAEKLDPRLR